MERMVMAVVTRISLLYFILIIIHGCTLLPISANYLVILERENYEEFRNMWVKEMLTKDNYIIPEDIVFENKNIRNIDKTNKNKSELCNMTNRLYFQYKYSYFKLVFIGKGYCNQQKEIETWFYHSGKDIDYQPNFKNHQKKLIANNVTRINSILQKKGYKEKLNFVPNKYLSNEDRIFFESLTNNFPKNISN